MNIVNFFLPKTGLIRSDYCYFLPLEASCKTLTPFDGLTGFMKVSNDYQNRWQFPGKCFRFREMFQMLDLGSITISPYEII